jgi:alcohol dehydrogenase class IV
LRAGDAARQGQGEERLGKRQAFYELQLQASDGRIAHWPDFLEELGLPRQAMVAAAMGQPGGDAAALLDGLMTALGMPRSLGAVGIGRDDFARIAAAAMATPWVPRNPRPIAGPEQVLEILELAA